MKRKMNQEVSRFCPLPTTYLGDENIHAKTLSRKLQAFDFLVSILDEEQKFSPHVYRKVGKIDWESLEALPWTDDQLLSIEWMKTIWTEVMQVVPRENGGIWPSNRKLREAILQALATDGGIPYMMQGYHDQKKPSGLLSLFSGRNAA
jgi:hypothetical protein